MEQKCFKRSKYFTKFILLSFISNRHTNKKRTCMPSTFKAATASTFSTYTLLPQFLNPSTYRTYLNWNLWTSCCAIFGAGCYRACWRDYASSWAAEPASSPLAPAVEATESLETKKMYFCRYSNCHLRSSFWKIFFRIKSVINQFRILRDTFIPDIFYQFNQLSQSKHCIVDKMSHTSYLIFLHNSLILQIIKEKQI